MRPPQQETANRKSTVLIVDDEPEIAASLGFLIERNGLKSLISHDGFEALRMMRCTAPDALLVDMRMPGMSGLELLGKARAFDGDLPVILITAFAEVQEAVEAMRAGAHDYLAKPFDHGRVLEVVRDALKMRQIKMDLRLHGSAAPGDEPLEEIFGASAASAELIAAIRQVAKSDFNVLAIGETGVGKELVATAIHRASVRSAGPFVPVDCGAIPETLLESELFGHERGAFTSAVQSTVGKIEAARGGTLFLDEISNMSVSFQSKLLRVLQDRIVCRLGSNRSIQVDFRLVAASNRDLKQMCREESFRSDLYFRLNDYTIAVPPLRERQQDILFLATRFLAMTNAELGKSVRGFSPAAIEAMTAYPWPGNVRQLRSVIRRAVLGAGETIGDDDLVLDGSPRPGTEQRATAGAGEDLPLREVLRRETSQVERNLIADTLQKTGGNKAKAARLLHVDYKTLYTKIRQYGIHA